MDSILDSVKSYCGILANQHEFDTDILMAINAVMFSLNQLGVGPEQPFVVSSSEQTWQDLLGEDPVGGVREYVNMRVKLLFDPSTNNQVMDALKEQIAEFEWRIVVDADKRYYETREVEDE